MKTWTRFDFYLISRQAPARQFWICFSNKDSMAKFFVKTKRKKNTHLNSCPISFPIRFCKLSFDGIDVEFILLSFPFLFWNWAVVEAEAHGSAQLRREVLRTEIFSTFRIRPRSWLLRAELKQQLIASLKGFVTNQLYLPFRELWNFMTWKTDQNKSRQSLRRFLDNNEFSSLHKLENSLNGTFCFDCNATFRLALSAVATRD